MKRDNDLIRTILATIEDHEFGNRALVLSASMFVKSFPGLKDGTLNDHIELLVNAGFLKAEPHQFGWFILGMTWAGHDFLANAKCPTIWDKAKQLGGHLAFDVFATVIKEMTLKSIRDAL